MTREDAETLVRDLEAIEAYGKRQHELAKGVVALFIETTTAMEPVMLACKDPVILARAAAELARINEAVMLLAAKVGVLH